MEHNWRLNLFISFFSVIAKAAMTLNSILFWNQLPQSGDHLTLDQRIVDGREDKMLQKLHF